MTIKTLEQTQTSSQFPHIGEEQLALNQRTRPDTDITDDVRRVLQADTILRATADQIEILVSAGVVTLRGYVTRCSHKVRAECDTRQVPGVRQVENYLIADPDLEVAVAQEIAQDTRLRYLGILVHATIGVIRLDGQVDRADLADAAERLAATVPNVRAVVNCIQSPDVANRPPERVFLPRGDQEVYASDGLLGRVDQVVMNPNNRRVTAIAVDAHFYHESLVTERRLFIPVAAVRNVNASGIELNLTVEEAERCADFDPAKFVMPDRSWQPPLDYVPNDILLESNGIIRR